MQRSGVGLVGLSLLLLGSDACASAQQARKPNVILIMTDDQGYGDLACHGNPHLQTPNLDRLYKESVRFTDFHVSPTCSPTRAALLTGRHEFKSGVTHTIHERERLSLKAKTLPQMLQSAGYATGIFGKWHLGDEDDYQPGKRGFSEVFIHGAGGIGQSYPGSCGDVPDNKYFDPVLRHNGKFVKTAGYCTDVFFTQALRWMESVKGRQPFFCYLTPNAPHAPLHCPPGSDRPYADRVPADVARFYGMIANIDANVGTLLDKLTAWGIERETLVIFMTDNGTATGAKVFNAGMRGAKNTPYEGGTRVPCFWRWPGTLTAGVDVHALTCHQDILPTLAHLTGTDLDAQLGRQVEGRSLVPLLQDPKANWGVRFFVVHLGRWPKGQAAKSQFAGASIRNDRWKLVFSGQRRELFDLVKDPGEESDSAEKHTGEVRLLSIMYDRWWQDVLPCLENEDAVGPAINPFKAAYQQQMMTKEGVPQVRP